MAGALFRGAEASQGWAGLTRLQPAPSLPQDAGPIARLEASAGFLQTGTVTEPTSQDHEEAFLRSQRHSPAHRRSASGGDATDIVTLQTTFLI